MNQRLTPIIEKKQAEIAELNQLIAAQPAHPIAQLLRGEQQRQQASKNFKSSVGQEQLSVIAEIKRHSPSKGALAEIRDPLALAQVYVAGGASAISVLTDEMFFHGHLTDLTQLAEHLPLRTTPILRKDFTLDAIQIAEAVVAGADAILLIVAILGEKTKNLIRVAQSMGIDALVEVHTQAELNLALEARAEIIGVNNRDLSTFIVDTDQAFALLPHIPSHIVKIAESGIQDPALAQAYFQAGFNAVLIGEALVKAEKPDRFIQQCRAIL